MLGRLRSVLAWTLSAALALAPVSEALAQSRNSFRPIFQPGGGVSSSTNKPAVGATTATGQVPAGASASCKRNGSVAGSASVTAQGTVTCTFGSALAAGDTVSIPWTLSGESPAVTATNGPTLGPLTLSPATVTVGTAYSGTLSGGTTGSTISLSGASAGLSVSGSSVTGTPTGTGSVSLIETLAGAANSPRTTSGALTVNAVPPSGSTPGQISSDLSDPNSLLPRV